MMPLPAHDRDRREHRVRRLALARAADAARRLPLLIAVDEPRHRAWAMIAAARARIDHAVAPWIYPLLDGLAAGASALVIGATFDGLPAERLLAFVRSAGCQVPAVVIAAAPLPLVVARAALAPVAVLVAPGAGLAEAPRSAWLDRCIALALGGAEAVR